MCLCWQNTSQWTLDYPPFFAYFELFLAFFARYFDAGMLRISAEPYTSSQTIVYQRLTVILSDVVFNYAAYLWIQELIHNQRLLSGNVGMFARVKPKICSSPAFILSTLFLFNVAHLIVDHIHFQYNGLLNGLLLLSMLRMVQERIYWSSFWFAVLLNFKHIYLYMAPAYFVFLLANYCLRDRQIQWKVIFKLAAVVLSVFAASFAPFIMRGQLFVLLARLFPFQRGLSHAYWAPNLWACYNGLDIILSKLFKLSNGRPTKAKSLTSGLVQQNEHQFLPTITPRTSIVCVVAVIGVCTFVEFQITMSFNHYFLSDNQCHLYLDTIETISEEEPTWARAKEEGFGFFAADTDINADILQLRLPCARESDPFGLAGNGSTVLGECSLCRHIFVPLDRGHLFVVSATVSTGRDTDQGDHAVVARAADKWVHHLSLSKWTSEAHSHTPRDSLPCPDSALAIVLVRLSLSRSLLVRSLSLRAVDADLALLLGRRALLFRPSSVSLHRKLVKSLSLSLHRPPAMEVDEWVYLFAQDV